MQSVDVLADKDIEGTWVRRKSAMRNMNLRMPSRREMIAESEMAMVRPRYFGWLMRAKMMPIMTASMMSPTMVCTQMMSHAHQQSLHMSWCHSMIASTWPLKEQPCSLCSVPCRRQDCPWQCQPSLVGRSLLAALYWKCILWLCQQGT